MPGRHPTRREAIRILERERAEVQALIGDLPPRAVTRPGIGRGAWSPKDLIGHLATWEGFALEALDHWDRGTGWPRESELWTRGVNPTNRAELERVRRRRGDAPRWAPAWARSWAGRPVRSGMGKRISAT